MARWEVIPIGTSKRRANRFVTEPPNIHRKTEKKTIIDAWLFQVRRDKTGAIDEITVWNSFYTSTPDSRESLVEFLSFHYGLSKSVILFMNETITLEEWKQRYLVYEPNMYTKDLKGVGSIHFTGQNNRLV